METAANNDLVPSSALGGLGGGTRDTRLIAKAVVNRWNFDPELEKELPDHLLRKALGRNGEKDREQISAAKAVVAMKGQNIQLKIYDETKGDESGNQGNVIVNVGVQVAQREEKGLTDEELDKAIDERLAMLASIEAKGVCTDA